MLSDYDLDDMVKTIPAESITSTDDVDCYEVCSKNIKKHHLNATKAHYMKNFCSGK